MKKVLILSPRDWLHPQAGLRETYLHQVFTRIAGHGHYVAWVPLNCGAGPLQRAMRPQLEMVDGIQIIRFGTSWFYRMMVSLLLRRLARQGSFARKFDVVVDCVNGQPLPVAELTDVPVLPLVFRLSSSIHGSENPASPMIAATDSARNDLKRAGVPESNIVSAPFGLDTEVFYPSGEPAFEPTMVAVTPKPRMLLRAFRKLGSRGELPQVDVFDCLKRCPAQESWTMHGAMADEERGAFYRRAWYAYCGEGAELQALALAACGIPVVCPDTRAGREFVIDNVTGLLHERRSARALARQLERLGSDEVLRKRLAAGALERAEQLTWEKTANMVLATIETLKPETL